MNHAYENECEYLAILINHNELIKNISIEPNYLLDEDNKKLLRYIIECYEKNHIVHHRLIYKEHEDFESLINHYVELWTNTYFSENNLEQQMIIHENEIINAYKEYGITTLNKQLQEKKLSYTKFMQGIEKINQIKEVNSDDSMLTLDNIDMSYEEQPTRIKSNTAVLDQYVKGFTLGQLSVWSGSNGSAKSTYLNQLAIESIEQGYKVAIYSGELMPKRLLNWIIGQCAGKSQMKYNDTKDYWYVDTKEKEKIINWLNNRLFIYDNSKGNNVKNIISSVKQCIKKNNVQVVILDNLMSMNLGDGNNKYDLQSQLVQELSALAKETNTHIHFVCHPRKAIGFLRKTDISGTADLTNIADNVFIVHRVNNDFIKTTQEMFKWKADSMIYSFTNIVEVCKNRDFGVVDAFVGMYFEPESKRLKDYETEARNYKWNTH